MDQVYLLLLDLHIKIRKVYITKKLLYWTSVGLVKGLLRFSIFG